MAGATGAAAGLTVRCRLCGGLARRRLRAMDYNRRLSDRWFTYHACTTCRSLLIAEPPHDLAAFYPDDYYHLPSSVDELAVIAEGERFKLAIVQQTVRSGRLLEIGPAVGGFAFLAKRAGFEVDTIEMDSRCCDFLRDVVGVGVVQSSDPRSALGQARDYDVIALWHVLEHLPDPWETLEAAVASLSPHGALVLAAPNPESLQFWTFGRYWAHLDAPRHLQLVPLGTLRARMLSLGMMPVLETTSDPGGLAWNAFGWQMSIRNLARSVGAQKAPTVVGRVAGRLMRPVERRGVRGSTYTTVLRSGVSP